MSGHADTIRWTRAEYRAEVARLLAENQQLQEELTTSYLRREADGLIAENQRLRDALEAADWLITNLRIFNEGGVVRGLSEANAGYESAREALRSEQ